MEFHVYPAAAAKTGGCRPGALRGLWQAQGLLHSSDSVALPAALLITAAVMVMYEHATAEDDTTVRNFLLMILLTMLPLAFLEKKLLSCADPVSVLSKCSIKVLMMHVCFLTMRLFFSYLADFDMSTLLFRNVAAVAMASVLLPTVFGFRLSRACLREHRDVWCLVLIASMTGMVTEVINVYRDGYFMNLFDASNEWYRKRVSMLVCNAASDYIEVLAFVPAVWMVYRAGTKAAVEEVSVCETQQRVLALFSFMIVFYLLEDLHSAYILGWSSALACMGHVAHFLLLLDFTTFILAHLYDPEKHSRLMGKFWDLFAERALV